MFAVNIMQQHCNNNRRRLMLRVLFWEKREKDTDKERKMCFRTKDKTNADYICVKGCLKIVYDLSGGGLFS